MNGRGERIKAEREALGWSQERLASKAGVSRGTISALENGNSRGTTYLLPIAKALNVNPQWIETGKGEKRPPSQGDEYISASSVEELAARMLDKGPEEVWKLVQLLLQTKR